MSKVQSYRSLPSSRTMALILVAGCVAVVASLGWFRNSPNSTVVALPTGLVMPVTVDPQQMTLEKKNLPVQRVSDFSLIFPETGEP